MVTDQEGQDDRVSIYALIDSRTGLIRYVGQTNQELSHRLSSHHDYWSGSWALGNWLRDVREEGGTAYVSLLERTDSKSADRREAYWIKRIDSLGFPLLNRLSHGGLDTEGHSLREPQLVDGEAERWRERRREAPRVFTDEEFEDLLDTFNTRWWTPHRNRTLCLVMAHAGPKPGEATSLRVGHVQVERSSIEIPYGTFPSRIRGPIEVPEFVMDDLQQWIERRDEKVSEECALLFPTRNETEIDHGYLRRMITRACRDAGIEAPDEISPSTLRHTFAVNYYQSNEDLSSLADALGITPRNAQIYTRVVDEEDGPAEQSEGLDEALEQKPLDRPERVGGDRFLTPDDLARRWQVEREAVLTIPAEKLPYYEVTEGLRRYNIEDIRRYEDGVRENN